jgi:hypothetical protein
MSDERWFGAKTLYCWRPTAEVNAEDEHLHEERVVLLRARDLDDALVRGEVAAEQYARDLEHAEYLGFIDVYEISDDILDGAEVYSLLRSSPLDAREFVKRCFDDGTEHSSRGRGSAT